MDDLEGRDDTSAGIEKEARRDGVPCVLLRVGNVNGNNDDNTLSLPGRWETIGAVSGSLSELVRFDFPDDYWQTRPSRLEPRRSNSTPWPRRRNA